MSFPKGVRHGTAFAVSGDVLARLQLKWNDALRQKAEWYGSAEAVRVADNLLLWQRETGGWPKNTDMAIVLSQQEAAALSKQKRETDSTIDNGATYTQMAYLARVFNATKQARCKDGFLRGLDYLFKAQYDNGGWPQFYPDLHGYYKHITFNDDAMVGVLELLRAIAQKRPEYVFVDEARRAQAERAVQKGIDCILKTQVTVNGVLTVWCAQHDEVTLQPAPARAYEKISLSGSESVGLVRFLMSVENPSPQIRAAIQAAVAWFEQTKLTGLKVIEKPDAASPKGYDKVVVKDASAGPLWARFYEIGTNRPIFCGRDGVIKYSLAEIEYERRTGYRWYVNAPTTLLAKDFPAWKKKWL
ncbi:MAG: pectate lyase [Acidobacteria bacterium]|nr:pectate lyase [Acidobacteriota bacterium]